MDRNDREQFCNFYRRSRYDFVQGRDGDQWGPLFSFTPCDPPAAQKAGQILLKMHRGGPVHVRHARRARLHDHHRLAAIDVVVATTFPGRDQKVFRIEDGAVLRVNAYLEDEALKALEAAISPPPRSRR